MLYRVCIMVYCYIHSHCYCTHTPHTYKGQRERTPDSTEENDSFTHLIILYNLSIVHIHFSYQLWAVSCVQMPCSLTEHLSPAVRERNQHPHTLCVDPPLRMFITDQVASCGPDGLANVAHPTLLLFWCPVHTCGGSI